MKLFNQLTLVAAIAAASTSAFALETLSDEVMSNTTGQDGLTIKITPGSNGIKIDQLLIHDNDGLGGNTGVAGAIVLGDGTVNSGNGLTITGGNITVAVDTAGGAATTGSDAYINAGITLGQSTINIGDISVGKSKNPTNTTYTGANPRGANLGSKILGGFSLTMDQASMNVQLGAQPQGAMVVLNSTITNGLKINDLEIVDANGADGATGAAGNGGLKVGGITLTDSTGANMTVNANIDIDADLGIVIEPIGSSTYYAYLSDVGFTNGSGVAGGAGTIGDVEVLGLNATGTTIAIAGR